MKRREVVVFECLALVIILVTGLDIWWSIALSDGLIDNELNPVARWILVVGDRSYGLSPYSGVAWLCALKCVTTWICLSICRFMVRVYPKIGWPVLCGLFAFFVWLAWFLMK